MNTKSQIKTVNLQLQTIWQRMQLSSHKISLANVETSVILNDFANSFEVTIIARMAGQKVQTYKHPKTWLDAFKLRWFPKWLQKKYSVEYVKLETWECYPEYAIPKDKFGEPVQFFMIENESYNKIKD